MALPGGKQGQQSRIILQLTDMEDDHRQTPAANTGAARNIDALAIPPTKRYARRYLV
jgi:hypothetical protein